MTNNIPETLIPYKSLFPLFQTLAANSPQTILLEGGTESGRLEMALLFACLQNQQTEPSLKDIDKSIFESRLYDQIKNLEISDLHVYDGRISNKQDEENPGLVRAMTIANMRELKIRIGSEPAHLKKRIAIFQGIGQTREEAINSLLKIVEEPVSHTCFIFLAPQRDQILPTIVSRSICVTLPWRSGMIADQNSDFENNFVNFLKTGKGFLSILSQKNGIELTAVEGLLLKCLHSLAECRKNYSSSASKQDELSNLFKKLMKEPVKLIQLQLWIEEALEMLRAAVNPGRCLEAFSTKLYLLLNLK